MKAAMEIRRMQYSRWENMEKPSVLLYAEIAGTVAYAHEKRLWDMTVSMELFTGSIFCIL